MLDSVGAPKYPEGVSHVSPGRIHADHPTHNKPQRGSTCKPGVKPRNTRQSPTHKEPQRGSTCKPRVKPWVRRVKPWVRRVKPWEYTRTPKTKKRTPTGFNIKTETGLACCAPSGRAGPTSRTSQTSRTGRTGHLDLARIGGRMNWLVWFYGWPSSFALLR